MNLWITIQTNKDIFHICLSNLCILSRVIYYRDYEGIILFPEISAILKPVDNFILITIPRCGSHLLDRLLVKAFGKSISRSHDVAIDTDKKIITIVRKPMDFVVSELAMVYHHYFKLSDLTYEFVLADIQKRNIQFADQMKTLLDRSSIIIDYDDLISSPGEVIDYLAMLFDTPQNNKFNPPPLQDNPKLEYLVSSKTSEFYPYVKNVAKDAEFNNINNIYLQLLSKSVDIA